MAQRRKANPNVKGIRVTYHRTIDGDTAEFKLTKDDDGEYVNLPNAKVSKDGTITCRLDSYDSPELNKGKSGPPEYMAEEVKEYLEHILSREDVDITVYTELNLDNYGRSLCAVEIAHDSGSNEDGNTKNVEKACVLRKTLPHSLARECSRILQKLQQGLV